MTVAARCAKQTSSACCSVSPVTFDPTVVSATSSANLISIVVSTIVR